VKKHSGILPNEYADQSAKQGNAGKGTESVRFEAVGEGTANEIYELTDEVKNGESEVGGSGKLSSKSPQ
jgi:hypothetical protein